jgi:hypothetical protein
MKKSKKPKNRFKAVPPRQFTEPLREKKHSEDLLVSIRRAEKEVIPIIRKMKLSPAAAQFLLAQYTYAFATGSNRLTTEDSMQMANTVLSLWQEGVYVPGSEYPFTLEETLQEVHGGLKIKEEYAQYFQGFTPMQQDQPQGIGQVSGGIVKHPETNLWQIWMIVDGPCTFLAAYREPAEAQRHLEEIIRVARKGGIGAEMKVLFKRLLPHGDGRPKQLPFDMMAYLMEHIHLYTIHL